MLVLLIETVFLGLLIFALATLVQRYTSRKGRIQELEQELSWYRHAALQGKMRSYQEEIEKRP